MSLVSFVPDAAFMLLDRLFRVVGVQRYDRDGQTHTELELIDQDGCKTTKSLEYLLDQYQKRNLRAPHDDFQRPAERLLRRTKVYPLAADIPPQELAVGKRCAKLLRAIVKAGGLKRASGEFWEKEYPLLCKEQEIDAPPSKKTIKRWVRKVVAADDIPWAVVLAPARDRQGGKGEIRAPADAMALMHKCVEDFYFGVRNSSVSSCHREMVQEFRRFNKFRDAHDQLATPGYKQLSTYIRSLPGYEVEAARFGKTAAGEKFVSARYRRYKLRPLQRVEVDHTPLDILAVDDNGALLGRVRLTLVIDCATKAILGYSIGFDGASAAAVLEALRHACTPKTYLAEMYPEVIHSWPMCGRFELLAMDNGQEFHSNKRFKSSILEFSMADDLAWMPRGKGRYKGLVERIQQIVNRSAIDPQPGSTGSHPHTRKPSEVPPEDCAVHTLSSLHRVLHIFICDTYNVTAHGRDKIVPNTRWKELTELMPVRLPGNFDRLELASGEIVDRKIQHYGIDICDLNTFNSPELQAVRRLYQHDDTVDVRVLFKPSKLDRIWFKDPRTMEWIPVENHDPDTRDLSQSQVQAMRRLQREAAKNEDVELSVAQAAQKMRAIGHELLAARTILQRKRGLMLLGLLPTAKADGTSLRGNQADAAPPPSPKQGVKPARSGVAAKIKAPPRQPRVVAARHLEDSANEPIAMPVGAPQKPAPRPLPRPLDTFGT